MTVLVSNVNTTTDSFGQWITKTNILATAMSNSVVTVNSNTSVGSAAITGDFTSNNLITSNSGSVFLGTDTSNSYINATSLVIRTTSSTNAVLTSAGLVLSGVASYTLTSMTIGDSTVTGSNVHTKDVFVSNSVTITDGNTLIDKDYIYTDQSNALMSWTTNTHVVGDNQANVFITRNGLEVYDNPSGTLVQNSKLTSTTLYVKNIYTDFLSVSGQSTNTDFNGNVAFYGANNYFDLGIWVKGPAKFTDNTVVFYSNTDFEGANNYFLNGLYSANVIYTDGIINARAGANSVGFIKIVDQTNPSRYQILKANSGVSTLQLTLPAADGANEDYLSTDGNGNLKFLSLNGNTSVNFSTRTLKVGSGVAAGTPSDGQIWAQDNVIAYKTSDQRLKENVAVITDALSKVQAINGVTFDWTDDYIAEQGGEDGYFVRKHDAGVIAQEIESVLPEAVGTKVTGYKAVQYEKIVPLLIEAIKELKAEIERLKNPYKVNEWQ
jgi:hypothetical protein